MQDRSTLLWLNQIISILDHNGATIFDLLLQVLCHGHAAKNLHAPRAALRARAEDIGNLIFEQEGDVMRKWTAIVAMDTYQAEISHLIQVRQGFHFRANHTMLDQLENFGLEDLGDRMKVIAPMTWQMISALLDADLNHRRRAEAKAEDDSDSDSTGLWSDDDSVWDDVDSLDEEPSGSAVPMELDEPESGEESQGFSQFAMNLDVDPAAEHLDGEGSDHKQPKKRCRRQDPVKRGKALMFTVRQMGIEA